MGDSTLDSELLVLIDNWPGTARMVNRTNCPLGGFTGKTHHNVVQPSDYRPGEKLCVWNEDSDAGQAGMATFIYLNFVTSDPALTVKEIVAPDSATLWYEVTNDPDDIVLAVGGLLAAVGLSAMTTAYWGWFWCGGVCPEGWVAGLGGNFATEGNVIAGNVATADLGANALGLGPCAGDTEHAIGFALAADA